MSYSSTIQLCAFSHHFVQNSDTGVVLSMNVTNSSKYKYCGNIIANAERGVASVFPFNSSAFLSFRDYVEGKAKARKQ